MKRDRRQRTRRKLHGAFIVIDKARRAFAPDFNFVSGRQLGRTLNGGKARALVNANVAFSILKRGGSGDAAGEQGRHNKNFIAFHVQESLSTCVEPETISRPDRRNKFLSLA
jgi:hypothetical protein